VEASELVTRIRERLVPVEQRLTGHPWVAAAEARRLQAADLRLFAAQQERIIRSDLRSVAHLVHRYGDTPSGGFFLEGLETESAALRALGSFTRAVQGEARPGHAPRLPEAQAYAHFVAWLAVYGSDAEFAAAFLVNLPAWGRNCGRLASAFRSGYGLRDGDLAFFDLFAGEAPEFERAAVSVIQAGLDRGVEEAVIQDAALFLQRYELMYWDALEEGRAGG
jgi:hypothetical protein